MSNLRNLAEADLKTIVEDGSDGFGFAISITDPAGLTVNMIGLSNDIGTSIDPETGVLISGRTASVALVISTLITAGMSIPESIAAPGSMPYVVSFNDINGVAYTFKVSSSQPDRAIGVVTCQLETYIP